MNNGSDLEFHVGLLGANRWLALTLNSPYVCLEAESKEALFERLRKLVTFVNKARIQLELYRDRKTPQFHATQIISARELEDA
jgi:hypothetical protein